MLEGYAGGVEARSHLSEAKFAINLGSLPGRESDLKSRYLQLPCLTFSFKRVSVENKPAKFACCVLEQDT